MLLAGWKNDRLKIINLRMQQVAFNVGLCLLKIHLRVKHNSGAGKMLTYTCKFVCTLGTMENYSAAYRVRDGLRIECRVLEKSLAC